MYSSIKINNFRGFEDVTLDGLSDFNIFSGLNNTGKSAALEAVFLHGCGGLSAQFAATTLRQFRGDPGMTVDRFGEQSPWDQLFRDFDTSNSIELQARFDRQEETVAITVLDSPFAKAGSFAGAAAQSMSRDAEVRVRTGGADRNYKQTVTASVANIPAPVIGGPVSQAVNFEFRIDSNPGPLRQAFILGPRIRPPHNELADKYSLLRQRGRQQILEDALRLVEPRLKRVEILMNNGIPTLHLDVGTGPSLPLTVLGDGVTAITNYILAIQEARYGIVVIDEIENGIHHTVMEDLWRYMYRVAERSHTQVFATTHSHECLEAATKALQKRRDALSLFRFSRPKNSSLRINRFDQEMLSAAFDQGMDVR